MNIKDALLIVARRIIITTALMIIIYYICVGMAVLPRYAAGVSIEKIFLVQPRMKCADAIRVLGEPLSRMSLGESSEIMEYSYAGILLPSYLISCECTQGQVNYMEISYAEFRDPETVYTCHISKCPDVLNTDLLNDLRKYIN